MAGEPFRAFISYSRSASGQLAVDLQNGIERFAKPWYRLRTMRVFRDDASMSANTALWSTIETGLREAEWFILLASPASAASQWVTQELDWWLRTCGPANLLIVLADGELVWDRQYRCFSPQSSALPPILQYAYPEEPRWIDLRWYAEDPSVAGSDPRFAERVADLAATLRGVDRDTLVGENVRQHRHAVRLARGGVALLAVLLVLSIVAGVVAFAQRRVAVAERNVAQTQATISEARQLAATSRTLLATNASLARRVAVHAYRLHPEEQTEGALLESLTSSPQLVRSLDAPGTVFYTAASADVGTLFAATRDGDVVSWDASTGQRTDLGSVGLLPLGLGASRDGTVVAATTNKLLKVWVRGTVVALPAGVPPDKIGLAVSPSGNTIVVAVDGPSGPSARTLQRVGATYELTSTIRFGTPVLSELALADDNTLSAWVDSKDTGHVAHYDLRTGRLTSEGTGGSSSARDYPGALSPDGSYVALPEGSNAATMPIYRTDHDYSAANARPDLIGYATGQVGASVALSPDARYSAYATAGVIYVAPTQPPGPTPFAITALRGMTEVSGFSLRFVGDRYLLSGDGSRLMLWDLRQDTALLTSHASTIPFVPHSGVAPRIITNGAGTAFVTVNWRARFSIITTASGASLTSSSTSVFLAWRDDSSLYYADTADGQVRLFDVAARKTVAQFGWRWPVLAQSPSQYDVTAARYVPETDQLLVAGARQIVGLDARTGATQLTRQGLSFPSVSADGRYGFGVGASNEAVVVDLATGAQTQVNAQIDPDTTAADQVGVFSGYDGNTLVTLGGAERLRTFWSEDGKTRLGSGPSAYEPAPFVSVLPNGTRYAEHRADHTLAIVDLASSTPIGSFAIAHEEGQISYDFSGDGTRLVVAVPQPTTTSDSENPTGLAMSIDLRPETWVKVACASAGRELTAEEWRAMTGQSPPGSLRCG